MSQLSTIQAMFARAQTDPLEINIKPLEDTDQMSVDISISPAQTYLFGVLLGVYRVNNPVPPGPDAFAAAMSADVNRAGLCSWKLRHPGDDEESVDDSRKTNAFLQLMDSIAKQNEGADLHHALFSGMHDGEIIAMSNGVSSLDLLLPTVH